MKFGYTCMRDVATSQACFAPAVAAGAVPLSPPKAKPCGQTVACRRCPDGTPVEPCTRMG